ncbi:DUF3047 domain-containing protein [Ramlibacter sp. AW1]|uniref:DUF3047 domain-containing protein n=1 Tax=Ramlibacter aurantiacus TaxID=2801330 RepID=A0A937D5I8_9BURK|nr:DUF3047 domain-containing protein [Ramlibacter aurantiacus]MBL0422750.1 DUF3047 domain-containing protein [Ramlibacter aurantiacus]
MSRDWKLIAVPLIAALVGGCATTPPGVEIGRSPWAEESRLAGAAVEPRGPWHHQAFPGKKRTTFSYARKDGRHAVRAQSAASASALRQRLHVPPHALGQLRFSWWVPALIEQADMRLRDADDSPVRVVLVFEGDRSRLSPRNAMLSELAQAVTGEPLPYATLMYVWSNQRPVGDVIVNPRTDRIRKLVVQSGGDKLKHWLDYERDIRSDFERVFGEPPGALVGLGLMTDSDNTGAHTQAWYGPVKLSTSRGTEAEGGTF